MKPNYRIFFISCIDMLLCQNTVYAQYFQATDMAKVYKNNLPISELLPYMNNYGKCFFTKDATKCSVNGKIKKRMTRKANYKILLRQSADWAEGYEIQTPDKLFISSSMPVKVILSILIIGTLLFQSCQTKPDPWSYAYNDWEVSNLKGGVKSVVKKSYGAGTNKSRKATDSLFGHEEKYFNSDGLMTKDILYRDELTELGYSQFRFDAGKNELIEQQYNLDHRKEDKIISKIDNKGQTTELTAVNRKGTFDYRRVFVYDSTNNFPGDAVEIKNYTGKKNHLTTTEKYRYNAAGNKTEEILLDKDGVRHHYCHEYDSSGHLVQLIRHDYDDTPMDTLIYRYRYDSIGNWTERKIYNNGHLNAVVKRKIEYYE